MRVVFETVDLIHIFPPSTVHVSAEGVCDSANRDLPEVARAKPSEAVRLEPQFLSLPIRLQTYIASAVEMTFQKHRELTNCAYLSKSNRLKFQNGSFMMNENRCYFNGFVFDISHF